MKVKIKGLVFVGFAAAILSANAMADDTNTVTSKSYVDAKYVGKANDYIDVSLNATTQKNDVSIKAAKIADDATEVHAGDEKLTTAAGVKAYTNGGTNGALATFNSSGALTSTPIVKSTESATNWSAQNFVGSDDKVPSEKAVVDALDALEATVGRNELEDSTYIQSEFNQTTQKTTVLIDPDQIANTVALIDAGGTPLTTAAAVGAYVNVRGVKVNGSALTPDASKDVNVTVAEGSTDGTVAVNGTDVPVHNAEVTTDKAAAIVTDVNANGYNANSTDKYASTKAVYDYVQAQTGGTVIPVMDTTVCTASTPCALVAEASGAVHWRTMATATDAGGACGDQGGCQ